MAGREHGTDPQGDPTEDERAVDEVEDGDDVEETDDADTTGDTDAARPASPGRTPRTVPAGVGRLVTVLFVLSALVAVGVVGWTIASRSWEVLGFEVAGDQAEQQVQRDELMDAGRQFVLRLGNYGPEELDEQGQLADYRESVGEVLTPAFRNSFFESLPLVEAGVEQSGVTREAEVFAAGVVDVESDRASVLVAGAFNDSLDGEPVGQPVALRLQVELVRVEGEWLVDNFTGVQAPDAEDEAPIDPELDIPEGGQQGGQRGGQQGGGQQGGGQQGGQQGGGQQGGQGGDR